MPLHETLLRNVYFRKIEIERKRERERERERKSSIIKVELA